MSSAPCWHQRAAEAALGTVGGSRTALKIGLPYADALLASRPVRRLPEGDREDLLQEVWIEALAADSHGEDFRAYLLGVAARLASRRKRQAVRERRRGRAWEENRQRGENQWP